jgi:hypothetical protein
MRCNHWVQLGAALLLSASLLNSPTANAQRGAHASRAGSISSRPVSRAVQPRINSRRPSSFYGLGGAFPGTNLFPGGATGVNGINSVLIPGNLGVEAAIDPATQWNLALAERLERNFAGSGVYLLGGGYGYAIPQDVPDNEQVAAPAPQQQPQIIVVQQPAAPGQQAAQQSSEQPDPALPDVGQFTLVLRNGTQIQAVAFTRMKESIVYITADGSRRTLALADLDSDATIRVNQERGTPLQLL